MNSAITFVQGAYKAVSAAVAGPASLLITEVLLDLQDGVSLLVLAGLEAFAVYWTTNVGAKAPR